MSHPIYALLSGVLVGAWWLFTDPFGFGAIRAGAIGIIGGVVMYGVIVAVYHLDSEKI